MIRHVALMMAGEKGKNMYKYRIAPTDRADIRIGDTVIDIDGKMRTVCKSDIKRNNFTGVTIHGHSYKMGLEKVKKIIFFNPIHDTENDFDWITSNEI